MEIEDPEYDGIEHDFSTDTEEEDLSDSADDLDGILSYIGVTREEWDNRQTQLSERAATYGKSVLRRMAARAAADEADSDRNANIPVPPDSSDNSSEESSEAERHAQNELGGIIDNVDPEKREKARDLILSILGIGSSILSFLPFLIKLAKGEKSDDPDEDTQKKIIALIDVWQKIPDQKFWQRLGDYFSKKPAKSRQFQLMLIAYIKLLSDNKEYINWSSQAERWSYAKELIDAYHAKKDFGDIYRKAATLTYKGKAFSRIDTAELIKLALGGL